MNDRKHCMHLHVHQGERWYGQGKYVFFQCKDCDEYLRPQWQIVDSFGNPIVRTFEDETYIVKTQDPK